MIAKTKLLKCQIEKLHDSSMHRMNTYLNTWNSLLTKEVYNNQEILKIKKIKSLKLVGISETQFLNQEEII